MSTRGKLLDLEGAIELVSRARAQGKKVVFTNGCFDLLHAGHVEYLEKARTMGDLLVVGINTDESVNALKGSGRPVLALEDRAAVLAGLACVDVVIPFHELDPIRLIRALSPDVLVKGSDWPEEAIVGAELVRERGGRVERIELRKGISTSIIIERILTRFQSSSAPAAPDPPACSRSQGSEARDPSS
ncbi:MAG: D-glycero-beta-D-manno-heptose 1-phosphate adenylyltransferase [Thermodesulfobacteriota bacterium]